MTADVRGIRLERLSDPRQGERSAPPDEPLPELAINSLPATGDVRAYHLSDEPLVADGDEPDEIDDGIGHHRVGPVQHAVDPATRWINDHMLRADVVMA